jgi:hypothetical protein
MKKFIVTYNRRITYTGTIEAENSREAQVIWDNGFTPTDEEEVDREGESIDFIEEE